MASGRDYTFRALSRGSFAQAQYVAKDGYEWERGLPKDWRHPEDDPGSPKDDRWLKERLPTWLPPDAEVRAPLARDRQNPSLHRTFARLAPTEKAILAFAGKWGHLGRNLDLSPEGRGYGESLAYWQREIETMGRLVALWDLVEEENRQALAAYVRWEERPRHVRIDVAYQDGALQPEGARRRAERVKLLCAEDHGMPPSRGPRLPAGDSRILACADEEHSEAAWFFDEWKKGDVIAPTRYYIHAEVNRHLEEHLSARLNGPDRKGKVELWFLPDCLLTGLYVLFALELSEQTHPTKMCLAGDCRRPFIPASRKQDYCSNRCRIRADAQRRRVLELKQEARDTGESL